MARTTPVTLEIDRSVDPSPVYVFRLTAGGLPVQIGTVSSTGIWMPTGPAGEAFAPSAFTDTTNAGNISSGILAPARLPTPTLTTLGAVLAGSAPLNQFATGINASGALVFAQPTFSNLAGTIASSQIPIGLALPNPSLTGTPNTPNLTGYLYGNGGTGWTASQYIPSGVLQGTISGALLPAPTASVLGGVLSGTAPTNQFQTGIAANGAPSFAQPAFGNLSGQIASGQVPSGLTLPSPILSGTPSTPALTGYLYGNGGIGWTAATTIPTTALTGYLQAAQHPALTGDVTSVAGSLTTTLATVNASPGAFGGASAIPVVTVNAKGLVTSVTTAAVVAPAGTLSGNALASTVTASSLTSVGTLTAGVWQASPVANAYLAPMVAGTIKGALSAGSPVDLTGAQATSLLSVAVGDTGSGGTKGLVPAAPAGSAAAGQFYSAGGSFSVPAAAGNAGGDLVGSYPNPTLAIVNSNTGSFGGASLIPILTLDGKGRVTVASSAAVVAPAGTLSGATLNATVVNSSLATFAAGAAYNNLAANSVDTTKLVQPAAGAILGNPTGAAANASFNSTLTAYSDLETGSTAQGYIPYRGASKLQALAPGTSGYVLTSNGAGAAPSYQPTGTANSPPRSNVRQTVQGGPQSGGAPSFLPGTSSSLSLTAQNIAAGVSALTVAAAQGYNTTGQNDIITQLTSNPTWSGLIGSQTVSSISATATNATVTTGAAHNLVAGATVTISGASQTAINGTFVVASVGSSTTYVINGPNPQTGAAFASGSVTGASYTVQNYLAINASSGATVSSLLVPIYQFGGTIPTTAGQFAFDRQAMIGYVAGTATPLVYVGQATTNATAVTSTLAYAYNGTYQSTPQAFPTSTTPLVAAHNIGVVPLSWSIALVFNTATNGYSVGDQISYNDVENNASPYNRIVYGAVSALSMQLASQQTTFTTVPKGGSSTAVSVAGTSVNVVFSASRGW